MHILLPPSEGKTEGKGKPFRPGQLSFAAELGQPRAAVMDGLVRLSAGPKAKALTTLGLSEAMAPLLVRNAGLATAPASSAIDVYTGVLYEALDWGSLAARARARGEESILISSALFGVLRPQDRIPAYRLSMDVALPRLGPLATYWKPALSGALADLEGLIIDCRSSTYAASWKAPVDRCWSVQVLTEKGGKRTVVSHMAKYSRGILTRLLLSAVKAPRTIDDVAAIAAAEFKVEYATPGSRKAGVLTLITRG
jgi:cytoplasmic iron level regulating protein YaaA (DUF328/UPF0246 family)